MRWINYAALLSNTGFAGLAVLFLSPKRADHSPDARPSCPWIMFHAGAGDETISAHRETISRLRRRHPETVAAYG
jgi:hypothetical protein